MIIDEVDEAALAFPMLVDFGDNPAGDPAVAEFSGLGCAVDLTLENDPLLGGERLTGLTLNRMETVVGTAHGDTVTGSTGDETLFGGEGLPERELTGLCR